MPEAGAGGTSGAVLGSCNGGNGTTGPRLDLMGGAGPVRECVDDGWLAIADVDRDVRAARPRLKLISFSPSASSWPPLESDGGGFGATPLEVDGRDAE